MLPTLQVIRFKVREWELCTQQGRAQGFGTISPAACAPWHFPSTAPRMMRVELKTSSPFTFVCAQRATQTVPAQPHPKAAASTSPGAGVGEMPCRGRGVKGR